MRSGTRPPCPEHAAPRAPRHGPNVTNASELPGGRAAERSECPSSEASPERHVTFSQAADGGQTSRARMSTLSAADYSAGQRLRATVHEPGSLGLSGPHTATASEPTRPDPRKGTTSEMIAFNWFGQGWVIPGANTAFLTSLIAATLLA